MSSPPSFFAPSFVVFFAPSTLFFGPPSAGPLRIADAEVVRMAVGAGRAFSASSAAPASGDGDFGRFAPFWPADKKGEAVRDTTGGVLVREGGLLGRLMVGLSHEEKKSSAGSPAGVEVPSPGVPAISSVMITSVGYLSGSALDYVLDVLDQLLRIFCCSAFQFLLILVRSIRRVFDFSIFAREGSGSTVGLEVFGRGLVSTDLK
jgi:hypothetical protein